MASIELRAELLQQTQEKVSRAIVLAFSGTHRLKTFEDGNEGKLVISHINELMGDAADSLRSIHASVVADKQ